MLMDGPREKEPISPHPLRRVLNYAIHVIGGAFMFLIPAIAAGGLNLLVHQAERMHIDRPVMVSLTILEYMLLGLDGWLFLGWFLETLKDGTAEFWGWTREYWGGHDLIGPKRSKNSRIREGSMNVKNDTRSRFAGSAKDVILGSFALYLRPLINLARSPHRGAFLVFALFFICSLLVLPFAFSAMQPPVGGDQAKQLAELISALSVAERKIQILEGEASTAEASFSMTRQRLDVSDKQLAALTKSLSGAEKALEATNKKLAEALTVAEGAKRDAEAATKEAAGIREKFDEMTRAFGSFRKEIEKKSTDHKAEMLKIILNRPPESYYSGVEEGRVTLPLPAHLDSVRLVDPKLRLQATYPLLAGRNGHLTAKM